MTKSIFQNSFFLFKSPSHFLELHTAASALLFLAGLMSSSCTVRGEVPFLQPAANHTPCERKRHCCPSLLVYNTDPITYLKTDVKHTKRIY